MKRIEMQHCDAIKNSGGIRERGGAGVMVYWLAAQEEKAYTWQ
jgi:hypothetical protein